MSFSEKKHWQKPDIPQHPRAHDAFDLNEQNVFLLDQQDFSPLHNPGQPVNNMMFARPSNAAYIAADNVPQANPLYSNSSWSDDMSLHPMPGAINMGSISSVSSPSVGPPVVQSSPENIPKRRVRGKPFLSEQEARLMETDDSQLTEIELGIKKKAQNRLAQRAFRERKETKLKELETKLLESEEERDKLREQLEAIRSRHAVLSTENSVLRSGAEALCPPQEGNTVHKFTFPKTQEQFIQDMMQGNNTHQVKAETVNSVYEEPRNSGRKLLAIGAVWDYLQIKQEEEAYENVDMMEVTMLLRGKEKCHGYGPAYPLEEVEDALRKVAAREHHQSYF
ncbi:putative fluconazole resistance protein [Clavispora lusitaniae]|uniref:BZIP domain-containing protein n=3 Tax=Clavispora lusitaniae TaxID=36911 RepID=C4Y3Z4_CLAL4|nr:uncharacterized protein CLUG_02366 [Clavispora lusitaniae ATCC 42720]KAF5211500.1 hypothetical protein E0198_002814 [Clavispora lusitaniae]EEQ38240.1 hypothetical protein CLUG_02366 [Clavispora lusitaniae ATCC 42720]KAF7580357.1 bZIP transcription factor family protein [Clavispora lusitaniae]OVF05488.1 putative AP-1-like transcription factor [Clavispora lusitaniae]QFZ27924.1 putative fluconazole resistance protein [Clavispora lusitaniae]